MTLHGLHWRVSCACNRIAPGERFPLWHWHASSCAGFVLMGSYRPVCSIVHAMRDCPPKAVFQDRMNRRFNEARHTGRIHDTWLIAGLLRGPLA